MRQVSNLRRLALAALLALLATSYAFADEDRSAGIPQVVKSASLAERSSAAFDQISSVASGRSSVSQIDPSIVLGSDAEAGELSAGAPAAGPAACPLTPEQQSIVTSLEAQGKLPAGDCEMLAWFSAPRDKSEAEDRQLLAGSVAIGAADMLDRDAEASRLARESEDLVRAQSAADAVAISVFAPPPAE